MSKSKSDRKLVLEEWQWIYANFPRFSLVADMRTKRLSSNVYTEQNVNILKTAGIYGPNNVGKTCLLRCIKSIRNTFIYT